VAVANFEHVEEEEKNPGVQALRYNPDTNVSKVLNVALAALEEPLSCL